MAISVSGTISADKWDKIKANKRAGVLAPLFCLYSAKSAGVGDLRDLKLLIDWAKLTGNSIVQLLPMNQMGPVNCPYDALSSFALEPVYVCLDDICAPGDKDISTQINKARKNFSAGKPHLDYAIRTEKELILRQCFARAQVKQGAGFKKFCQENSYWLADFALYKSLKEFHQGLPWYDWPDKYKSRNKEALDSYRKSHAEEIEFQAWLQWQLYRQFKEARSYASSRGILIKGDLPILVSRDSSDVWAHPEFFKLEFASGAPPDMYCAKGQRWGMPTYNWENIAQDGYQYLKEKLKYAQNFYDILRIDHVVGLFRIWSIPYNEPLENQGLNGFFDPSDQNKWGQHGRNLLTVMSENTRMLLCAEDLGVIPQVCTDTLRELGIPGNDVQRWVKDWKIKHDFLPPQEYRALSVAMLSTHDTTNWPAWWENEAGTVDEGLFIRKCSDHRQINFEKIKDKLFDPKRCGHGRLRWLESVDSVDKLVAILEKPKEHVGDFIDLYVNSYCEKEKLWRQLMGKGRMKEASDTRLLKSALKLTLDSLAVCCVNTIVDYLYLGDIFKGDAYAYRMNTPGTTSSVNWSLTIPLSLEELLKHKLNKDIRRLITDSGRI
ncbi:MAG: 4-alpha-glucanotransferase [Candidatus Omnitrophica bacterium]|nr:4-alpha-glucanotransferase [Candidatus Omnitrophota bacterium]